MPHATLQPSCPTGGRHPPHGPEASHDHVHPVYDRGPLPWIDGGVRRQVPARAGAAELPRGHRWLRGAGRRHGVLLEPTPQDRQSPHTAQHPRILRQLLCVSPSGPERYRVRDQNEYRDLLAFILSQDGYEVRGECSSRIVFNTFALNFFSPDARTLCVSTTGDDANQPSFITSRSCTDVASGRNTYDVIVDR